MSVPASQSAPWAKWTKTPEGPLRFAYHVLSCANRHILVTKRPRFLLFHCSGVEQLEQRSKEWHWAIYTLHSQRCLWLPNTASPVEVHKSDQTHLLRVNRLTCFSPHHAETTKNVTLWVTLWPWTRFDPMRKMMSKTKLENLPVTSRPSRRRSDGLWKRACNVHQSSIICFPVWGHELLWSSVISFWKSWSCGQMWTMWTMDCRKSCCLNKPFACCDTGPKLATGQVHGQVWGQLQETPNAKHWRICCKNGKMLVASQALFLFILFSLIL